MIIALIILSVVFAFLSGFSKAICDLSEEGKIKGNPIFWIKNISWKNKWKNGDKNQGEKFFGSSRWFVALTCGWHLFGMIERIGFVFTYLSIGILITISNWYWFMLFCYPFSMGIFHIFHDMSNVLKFSNNKNGKGWEL